MNSRARGDIAAVFADGLIVTDIPALDASPLRLALSDFMARDQEYRNQFLQAAFNYGFDGYSFAGQADSTHQAPDDLLHSFVFSTFHNVETYPAELQSFLAQHWLDVRCFVQELERQLLANCDPALQALYEESMGHMCSANYYPPMQAHDQPAEGGSRLSEHPDVSLVTVFPYGVDEDFEYQGRDGCWRTLPVFDRVIAFPGYLAQWLTGGEITALNHRVRLSARQGEARMSFATFSLPGPQARLSRAGAGGGEHISSEGYFKHYLSLWDY